MSADEVTPIERSVRPLWFWAAVIVLLGPMAALILHRVGKDSSPPQAAVVTAAELRKERSQAQEIAAALLESQRLLDSGQGEASLVAIRRVLAIDPKNASAYNNLCVANGLIKNRSAAIAACTQALQLDPSNERTRNNLRWVSSLPEQASR